jgi:hypothetical protein
MAGPGGGAYDATVRIRSAAIAACLAVAVLAGRADAAKTDIVVLRNGDRLTCELKSLDRGRIQVKTDDMGTIAIEWDKVARVSAPRTFEVEMSSGQRYLGALSSPDDGRLTVTGASGAATLVALEVVRIDPIGRSFFRRWDGSLDLGFSYVKSSGVSQFTVNTQALYRKPAFELTYELSAYFTRERDADDNERISSNITYTKVLERRWEASGLVFLERNPELGFDARTGLAGLLSRRLVSTNRARFAMGGGLAVSREQALDGQVTTNLDGIGILTGSFFTYDTPKTDLTYAFTVFPGLTQWGRIRLEPRITVRRELWSDFTLSVSAYDSYDNQPPVEDVSTNDVGVTLSIGWTF